MAQSPIWHAKEGEDRWAWETLGQLRRGYFVEVGAADGVSSSDTYSLERYFGWSGIAVEPNALFFAKLAKSRRCVVEHLCLAEADGEVDFIEASWFGRIRSHALVHLDNGDHLSNPYLRKDLDGSPAQVTRRRAVTFSRLLDSHGAPAVLDFVSVDAEGSEYEILREFPFERYKMRTLVVDSKMRWKGELIDCTHAKAIRQLLAEHGYRYDRARSTTCKDDYFVGPSFAEHCGVQTPPQQ